MKKKIIFKLFNLIVFLVVMQNFATSAETNTKAPHAQSTNAQLNAIAHGTNDFIPNTLRTDFEQSFISITGEKKSSKGSLDYEYPGHLRLKEFKDNTEFVCNPQISWYYIPPFSKGEKGSVQINNSKNMVISKLFDQLKNGLKDNEFYSLELKGNQTVVLTLTSKGQEELKLKSAVLSFGTMQGLVIEEKEPAVSFGKRKRKIVKKKLSAQDKILLSQFKISQLHSLALTYIDGKEVDLTLFNYQENINYPKDHFVFVVPPKTEIIQN